ncbi:hypothetical protein [Pedobacter sp. MR2016-24]|uniref:hypothetical protein n=1 Tax=Pedobacter sp. MR2016-24 TaxID=2994466 RepID=UPI002246B2AD|nr:hypothetical protein [Pedobacter sp. MR2016-24]MCX2485507.1 hypothetical protein [Pedobacter sp. MR2016-24]
MLKQPIPVYAINLKKRCDRKAHILAQFSSRSEFDLSLVQAEEDPSGAVGLWKSIRKIIQRAITADQELVIICEDDHLFTDAYQPEKFIRYIRESQEKNADLLSGGLSWFDSAVQVAPGLFWLNQLRATQFMVVFRSFYQKIMNADFLPTDSADTKLSSLTSASFVIFPFISYQEEFGYSDTLVAEASSQRVVTDLFRKTELKLAQLVSVNTFYPVQQPAENIDRNTQEKDSYDDFVLPVYIITHHAAVPEAFTSRPEFTIQLVAPGDGDPEAAMSWETILRIIRMAGAREDEEVIMICHDDLQFSPHYSKNNLFEQIIHAGKKGAGLLLGHVAGFDQAVELQQGLFWIDSFYRPGFLIFFRSSFDTLLNACFVAPASVDSQLCALLNAIMLVDPALSLVLSSPEDQFGHSEYLSQVTATRLQLIHAAAAKYGTPLQSSAPSETIAPSPGIDDLMQLYFRDYPKYVRAISYYQALDLRLSAQH